MTREEAIKVLEMFLHKQCDLDRTKFAYDSYAVWEAVHMAFEALEHGVTVTNGDVVKMLFPNADVRPGLYGITDLPLVCLNLNNNPQMYEACFAEEWWNAPYKAESEAEHG